MAADGLGKSPGARYTGPFGAGWVVASCRGFVGDLRGGALDFDERYDALGSAAARFAAAKKDVTLTDRSVWWDLAQAYRTAEWNGLDQQTHVTKRCSSHLHIPGGT